jgi:L-rhamnose isomerase/sugar isomerase
MEGTRQERAIAAIELFRIEIPSWGFANTGTRFGKYFQPAAARTLEEKVSDAAMVHSLTGACPSVSLHDRWDLPGRAQEATAVKTLLSSAGMRAGSINPNLFEDQKYRFGSLGNPDPAVRSQAIDQIKECIAIADTLGSRDISLWFADGSNYPGSANIRQRKHWFEEALQAVHRDLRAGQALLIEYKPFEPAFYHTDVADWGMALLLARAAGPEARVLVDTGHHYQSQNIEQIVAWLLAEGMLGGFHFNDRRYADDDLTLGSIDPYQVFRIFHEMFCFEHDRGKSAGVRYMIDQSHNVKGKIEATVQTVTMAQELHAKAALVDRAELCSRQMKSDTIGAEVLLQDAFSTDVRPLLKEWRISKGLPADPLGALRESGYVERITRERGFRDTAGMSSYA